jgi:CHAT domain-containing protein
VARVATRLNTTDVLQGDDATAAAFLSGLSQAGLLHVTSHAAFEPQAPLLARLLLADRPVFAFEIALAKASVSAVNLSGCSTAAQLTAPGGEGDGLAAALLAAGAQAVVASWWPVRDDVAVAFNDAFYGHVTGDVWTAVNAAQRVVLNEPGWDHPAVWAPFVVLGTPVGLQS